MCGYSSVFKWELSFSRRRRHHLFYILNKIRSRKRKKITLNTWKTGDVTTAWITGVMPTGVRIVSDTVDRTIRQVIVGITVQLVLERQTGHIKT